MILCWAAFTANLGCMRPAGRRLDTSAERLGTGMFVYLWIWKQHCRNLLSGGKAVPAVWGHLARFEPYPPRQFTKNRGGILICTQLAHVSISQLVPEWREKGVLFLISLNPKSALFVSTLVPGCCSWRLRGRRRGIDKWGPGRGTIVFLKKITIVIIHYIQDYI